jgi:hypothetical protein
METITFLNPQLTMATFVGTFTLVAANGDSISGTVAGSLAINSTGLFDVTETFEITDGTGRFDGATGSAVGAGQATPAGVAQETFQGTISSPGSLK